MDSEDEAESVYKPEDDPRYETFELLGEDPEWEVDAIKWAKWRDSRREKQDGKEGWHYGVVWKGWLKAADDTEEALSSFPNTRAGGANPKTFWQAFDTDTDLHFLKLVKKKQREPPRPPEKYRFDRTGYVFVVPKAQAKDWIRGSRPKRDLDRFWIRLRKELGGEQITRRESDEYQRRKRVAAREAGDGLLSATTSTGRAASPVSASTSTSVRKTKKKRIDSASPEPDSEPVIAVEAAPRRDVELSPIIEKSPKGKRKRDAEPSPTPRESPPPVEAKKAKTKPPDLVLPPAATASAPSTSTTSRPSGSIFNFPLLKNLTFRRKQPQSEATPSTPADTVASPTSAAPANIPSANSVSAVTESDEPLFLAADSPATVKEEPSSLSTTVPEPRPAVQSVEPEVMKDATPEPQPVAAAPRSPTPEAEPSPPRPATIQTDVPVEPESGPPSEPAAEQKDETSADAEAEQQSESKVSVSVAPEPEPVIPVPSSDEPEEIIEALEPAVEPPAPAPVAISAGRAGQAEADQATVKTPLSPKARPKYQQPTRIKTIVDAGERAVAQRLAHLNTGRSPAISLPERPKSALSPDTPHYTPAPPGIPTGPKKAAHPPLNAPLGLRVQQSWRPTGSNAAPLPAPTGAAAVFASAYQPRQPSQPAAPPNPYIKPNAVDPYRSVNPYAARPPAGVPMPQQPPLGPSYDATRDPRLRAQGVPALGPSAPVPDRRGSLPSHMSPNPGAGNLSPYNQGGVSPYARPSGAMSPLGPQQGGISPHLMEQGRRTPVDPRLMGGMSPLNQIASPITRDPRLPFAAPTPVSPIIFGVRYAPKNRFDPVNLTEMRLQLSGGSASQFKLRSLFAPLMGSPESATILFEEMDLFHLEWQLENGAIIDEWAKVARASSSDSNSHSGWSSFKERLADVRKIFVAYTERPEPVDRHYAFVIAHSTSVTSDAPDLTAWQNEHKGVAMFLISLPLSSPPVPELPDPVASAWALGGDKKPDVPLDFGAQADMLESYGLTDDLFTSLAKRNVAVLPRPNGEIDTLYAKVVKTLKNAGCRPGLVNGQSTDAVLIGNRNVTETVHSTTIQRTALPKRTKLYAFGPALQLPPCMWTMRPIWQAGGLVTFSPTFILRSPDKFGEIMTMIRTSPTWAAYIIPSVLDWSERSWSEPARCPNPLKAYATLVRSLFIDQSLLQISGSAANTHGGLAVSTVPPPHTLPEAYLQWIVWLRKLQQQTDYRTLVDACQGIKSGGFIGDAATDRKPVPDDMDQTDVEEEQLEDLVAMRMRPHVVPYRRYVYIGHVAMDKAALSGYTGKIEHVDPGRFAAIFSASV